MRPPLVKRQPFPPPPTHTPQSKHQNFPSQRATVQAEGDCHYAKISGNFGANVNGTVWPRWKFSGQSSPPPEVVLLDLSVRTDQKLPFRFQKLSFPVPLQLVTTHTSQNGG